MSSELPTVPTRLFVAQPLLAAWVAEGRVVLEAGVLRLAGDPRGAGQTRESRVEAAVRFLRAAGGVPDPHALVGRVEPVQRLTVLGGKAAGPHVVVGGTAYEFEPGYLVDAATAAAAARPSGHSAPRPAGAVPGGRPVLVPEAPPAVVPPRSLPPELEERREDAEVLARFLLDNIS